jgi:prepilin-type N-terminal cleavage/methylation domain-containing protein
MRVTVKERSALRRRRARSSGGFTLLEMMVVVLLVAIIAMLAAPSMTAARNDRLAFDLARQASELFHNARARSSGRGAAHLVAFTTQSSIGTRGAIYVFEALDGSATPGPNPSTTCRSAAQWKWASEYTPGPTGRVGELLDTNRRTRLIDFVNANATGAGAIQVLEDIRMTAKLTPLPDPDPLGTPTSAESPIAFVMCTTPNGSTYVGTGDSIEAAVAKMTTATQTFKDLIEVDVARHRSGAAVGLTRRVLLPGAGAPRIKSE